MRAGNAQVLARRYHVHVPGLVYVGITVMLILGAINSQNNLLFWAFGLAVAGILVSGVLSGAALMGLSVERTLPARAVAGTPFPITYRVRHAGRFVPCFSLTIEELRGVRGWRGGVRAGSTWWERLSRPAAFVAHVAPRSEATATAMVRPHAPGIATFDALRVSTTFPFGLTLKAVVFSAPESLVVRPWAAPVRADAAEALGVRARHGTVDAMGRGQGDEFFGLREHAPGDGTRRIAWKASARAGQLLVRENAAFGARRVWLELGDDVGEAPGPSRGRALSLAAGLAGRLRASGVEVGLLARWGDAAIPPSRSVRHGDAILDALGRLATPGRGVGRVTRRWSRAPGEQRLIVHAERPASNDRATWPDDPRVVAPGTWDHAPGAHATPADGDGPGRDGRAWKAIRRWLGIGGAER